MEEGTSIATTIITLAQMATASNLEAEEPEKAAMAGTASEQAESWRRRRRQVAARASKGVRK